MAFLQATPAFLFVIVLLLLLLLMLMLVLVLVLVLVLDGPLHSPLVSVILSFVKTLVKRKEKQKGAPLDPVLFAATVPARKPTAKDLKDIKKHENDPIEPKEYDGMDEMVAEL